MNTLTRTFSPLALFVLSRITPGVVLCCAMLNFTPGLYGQCMMIPISVEDQSLASDLTVEGIVTEKSSFESNSGNMIYTSYTIEITKIFKGNTEATTITIIEEGGIVGTRQIRVEPSISMRTGETGTFFVELFAFKNPLDTQRFRSPLYRAYASAQSLFSYNPQRTTVIGHFGQYALMEWYDHVQEVTGSAYKEMRPLPLPSKPDLRMIPNITSISPLNITAGTFSVLTINGTGFGASTSIVEFKNANDGGATWFAATNAHILLWTDTQIQLRVPTGAGTGQVRVTAGGSATSAQSLTVPYNQFTAEYDVGGTMTLFKRSLYNQSGNGGYVFRYFTEFNDNGPARQSFERALNSWRCATGVNFTIGATTSIDVTAQDGVNGVRFDNGAEIPAGVGAQAFYYSDNCAGADPVFTQHITELDLRFNDVFTGLTWEYGPALPSGTEIDFETIALHELGHCNALGHVNNLLQVMHYLVNPGEAKRVLAGGDLNGGIYVQAQNTGNPAFCDHTPMISYRQVKYVDHTALGVESGDSWSQAYKKLQDALAGANACVDTIYVAAGTYYPDEGAGLANDNQTLSFNVDEAVVLMGGYDNGGGTRNLTTNATILSGDIEQDNVTDAQNSQTVVLLQGTAQLDGFWIERGYADGDWGGGAMFNTSNGVVRNVVFRNNTAAGANLGMFGGAVFQNSGNPDFVNALFYGNTCTAAGSAMYIQGGLVDCINCTIASNSIYAVHAYAGTHKFQNSIFYNNSMGDVIMVNGQATFDISNSMLQVASVQPGISGTNVLFSANPLFVNLGENLFSITQCSPAINSGNNSFNTTTTDIYGNARVVSGIDRGAFENTTGGALTLVTALGDSGPGTLRDIMANCCAGNTITFAPALLNQTITLNQPLFIDKNLTIDGPGMDQLTITRPSGSQRLFWVNSGITATIKELTLNGSNTGFDGNCVFSLGAVTLQSMRLTSPAGGFNPARIYNAGNVTMKNQVIVE